MGLKTSDIVKILQLKQLGRRTAFKIYDIAKDHIVENENDLIEFILDCSASNKIQRLPMYTKSECLTAFEKGENIIEKSESSGIKILAFFEDDFPKTLQGIQDKPILINVKGNYKEINTHTGIAIIGTRKPTTEGIKSGEFFGEYFGKLGFNVVSGLALGCDTSAHKGCLKGKGFTTAIVAHGLHTVYPKENFRLAEDILSSGGVLFSEYFVGTGALANYFVERDRLQAGLSIATIVIQSGIKGGTMHAVNATLDSNKKLAAVKYNSPITSEVIEGNEMLIRKNMAFPLTSKNVDDFIKMELDLLSLDNNIKTIQPSSESQVLLYTVSEKEIIIELTKEQLYPSPGEVKINADDPTQSASTHYKLDDPEKSKSKKKRSKKANDSSQLKIGFS